MAQLSTSTARRSLQRALRRAVRPKRHHDLMLLQRKHHRRLRHRNAREDHGRSTARCRAAQTDCKAVETAIVLMMADVEDKQQSTKVALDRTNSECDAVTADLEREMAFFDQHMEQLTQ